MNKNVLISLTRASTRAKHKKQRLRVFDLKLLDRFISKSVKERLIRLFLEAKWFYNDIIRTNDAYTIYNWKNKVVTRFDKNDKEIRQELKLLTSSLRQAILDQFKTNVNNLAKAKKKGIKVGALNYVKEFNSIDFKQYGITHEVRGNKIKLQGFKKLFRVLGIEQLPKNCEFKNAKLVMKADGFHLYLTTFQDVDQQNERKEYQNKSIGLDFGIKNSVISSKEGFNFNEVVKESERLKRLHRSLSRKTYRSNNYFKVLKQLQKEYLHLSNIKEDLSNKYVSKLFANNEIVCIQDDNLNSWKKKKRSKKKKKKSHCFSFGKKIQHGCLGRIKAKIKRNEKRVSIVERFTPTTKVCFHCQTIVKMTLGDRTFVCPQCGHTEDRDIHAAKNIERLGMMNLGAPKKRTENIGMDGTECVKRKKRASRKPVETKTSGTKLPVDFKSSLVNETGMDSAHVVSAYREDAKSHL